MTDDTLKKIVVTLQALTVFLVWHFHEPYMEECTNNCVTDLSSQHR
jgi:hypothetical protein